MNEYEIVNALNELEAELVAYRIKLKYGQVETDSGLVLEALGSLTHATKLLEQYLLRGYK